MRRVSWTLRLSKTAVKQPWAPAWGCDFLSLKVLLSIFAASVLIEAKTKLPHFIFVRINKVLQNLKESSPEMG